MAKWQNLDLAQFDDVDNVYGFPIVEPVYELPKVHNFIEFDDCTRYRADTHNRKQTAVHFFEDDYKFERVWTGPDRYGEMLSQFGYIIGPDFSVFLDWPLALKLYNHYRNNWLVRYWQTVYNMPVIPTVMWGNEDSWDYSFAGLPHNSIVAVSSVGNNKTAEQREYFRKGYDKMMETLSPSQVICFSRSPMDLPGNVTYVQYNHFGGNSDGRR